MKLTIDHQNFISDTLKKGHSVAQVARMLNIKYSIVYNFSKKIGYDISWRSKDVFIYKCDSRRKLKISDSEILELYDLGESQASISRLAGCTRERIRQIIKKYGKTPASEINKKLKKEKLERAQQIQTFREEN